jgi:hypothetical protein
MLYQGLIVYKRCSMMGHNPLNNFSGQNLYHIGAITHMNISPHIKTF